MGEEGSEDSEGGCGGEDERIGPAEFAECWILSSLRGSELRGVSRTCARKVKKDANLPARSLSCWWVQLRQFCSESLIADCMSSDSSIHAIASPM